MKAIVHYEYGLPDDVLELQDIDKPMVKDDEVLVRVQAVGIHAGDWLMVRGIPYLMRVAQTKELCSGIRCGRAR